MTDSPAAAHREHTGHAAPTAPASASPAGDPGSDGARLDEIDPGDLEATLVEGEALHRRLQARLGDLPANEPPRR